MSRELLSKVAYDELTGRIKNPSVLDAFHLIIDRMGEMGCFEFKPNIVGKKKSMHFSTGPVSYFAFIANNDWLLWYFREPGFRQAVFTWEQLEVAFPKLGRSKRAYPEKQEGIFRITGPSDAEKMLRFVASLNLRA